MKRKVIMISVLVALAFWWFYWPQTWLYGSPQTFHVKQDYTKIYGCKSIDCPSVGMIHKNGSFDSMSTDLAEGWIKVFLKNGGLGYIRSEDILEQ